MPSPAEPATRAAALPAWKKALFAAVAVAGFFALVELALAIAGVRPATAGGDPFVGFASNLPLFVREPGDPPHYVTARAKLGWFNAQRFPARKAPGAVRIFALGGSTTYGHPWDDRVSFAGWLREFLPLADASRQWEVVNAGGISYASYRVAALMDELVGYEPDLFVIYTGHNEFLERRTYAGLIEAPPIVARAGGLAAHTRLYAAGARLLGGPRPGAPGERTVLPEEVDEILAHSVGPEDYRRDDAWRRNVAEHFRFNLRRTIVQARAAGAEVILVTPAAMLADMSPFKSEPSPDLAPEAAARAAEFRAQAREALDAGRADAALAALDEALTLDPRFAEAHYGRGRALVALGRAAEARQAFERALDEDVCPLRAPSEIVEAVRAIAAEMDVPLVDYVRSVAARAPGGIPGAEQFIDHVHPRADEYRQLTLEIVETMESRGLVALGPGWTEAALDEARRRVEAGIDREAHAQALRNLARLFGWAGKFEEAARVARQALDEFGPDADAYNTLGRAAAAAGRHEEALGWFAQAVEQNPNHAVARTNLGMELAATGRLDEAIAEYRAALRARPGYAKANLELGLALSKSGDAGAAERLLRKAVEAEPTSPAARNNLGAELAALGRPAEAIVQFEEALRLNPGLADAAINLGQSLAQLGRTAEAERTLRRAIEIEPSSAVARFNLGVVLQQSDRADEAVEQYRAALEREPRLSGAHHNLAAALLAQGRDEEALAALRRALEIDPEFARTHPEIVELLR